MELIESLLAVDPCLAGNTSRREVGVSFDHFGRRLRSIVFPTQLRQAQRLKEERQRSLRRTAGRLESFGVVAGKIADAKFVQMVPTRGRTD